MRLSGPSSHSSIKLNLDQATYDQIAKIWQADAQRVSLRYRRISCVLSQAAGAAHRSEAEPGRTLFDQLPKEGAEQWH